MSPLAKKLGIKPDHRVVVLGAPEGILDLLEPLPEGASVSVRVGRTPSDCALVFAADAAALPASFPVTDRLWIAYPKGGKKAGTDLNRDILWEKMGAHGLTGVSLVAVDGVWSAMRFRPTAEVGA
ncbi:MAG TPA: hypothetical protein VGF84_04860 [Micromonosporaceae bacterium]